jgi:hypothetical protein
LQHRRDAGDTANVGTLAVYNFYKPKNEGSVALRTDCICHGRRRGDQDADLEYDPRDIPPLLGPILEDERTSCLVRGFCTESLRIVRACTGWAIPC